MSLRDYLFFAGGVLIGMGIGFGCMWHHIFRDDGLIDRAVNAGFKAAVKRLEEPR